VIEDKLLAGKLATSEQVSKALDKLRSAPEHEYIGFKAGIWGYILSLHKALEDK
jgi:hypothetical protein